MTYREALDWGREQLQRAGISDVDPDTGYLMEYVSGMKHMDLMFAGNGQMEDGLLDRYKACIKKRARHIPLQQITGSQNFMGLSFRVNEHVLCPRQDTETLAEEGLKILGRLRGEKLKRPAHSDSGNILAGMGEESWDGKMHILDLCTGSGCILISLLYLAQRELGFRLEAKPGASAEARMDEPPLSDERRGQKREEGGDWSLDGLGTDLSEEALALARENARRNGVPAAFLVSDLFDRLEGTYDLITANPPYIPSGQVDELMPEVRDHEPHMALDGGEDGLAFYRRILAGISAHLNAGGYLLVEIGCDQGEAVKAILADGPFDEIRVVRDLAGRDRVVSGRRIHV